MPQAMVNTSSTLKTKQTTLTLSGATEAQADFDLSTTVCEGYFTLSAQGQNISSGCTGVDLAFRSLTKDLNSDWQEVGSSDLSIATGIDISNSGITAYSLNQIISDEASASYFLHGEGVRILATGDAGDDGELVLTLNYR